MAKKTTKNARKTTKSRKKKEKPTKHTFIITKIIFPHRRSTGEWVRAHTREIAITTTALLALIGLYVRNRIAKGNYDKDIQRLDRSVKELRATLRRGSDVHHTLFNELNNIYNILNDSKFQKFLSAMKIIGIKPAGLPKGIKPPAKTETKEIFLDD